MAVNGYVNSPFLVNITMHAAIHADHFVGLYSNDARLTVDSSTANMIFTPANWNVAQQVRVTGHAPGDLELLAHISSSYFVNGAGVRRFIDGLVDLSVTILPLDTWTGTVPKWSQNSGGDLFISHLNLVAGDVANISRSAITGLTFDKPFNFNSPMDLLVTAPDGTQTVMSSGFSGYAITMTQIGIYRFEPIQTFALLQRWDNATGHVIQGNTFDMSVVRGLATIVPTTSITAKSQGVGYADASLQVRGLSAGLGPITPQTLPVGGPSESTFLGSLTMNVVGTPFLQRATGSATGSGATAVFTGSVTSGGGWQIAYDAGSGQINLSNDGVACASALTMSIGS